MTGGTNIARIWVDCYTSLVGAEASERRRAEIESDLWEQQQTPAPGTCRPQRSGSRSRDGSSPGSRLTFSGYTHNAWQHGVGRPNERHDL